MQRRSALGNTTTARVKSLLLFVQHQFGPAEADAFLKTTRLDREYIDDETRPLPADVWHSALIAFTSRWGKQRLPETIPFIVHPENLGVWTRVLRGTEEPRQAFEQLAQYGGEHVMTESWQTLHAAPGLWRGRIVIHDAIAEEADGLCSLARAAELAAVPLLFGLPAAKTKLISTSTQRDGSVAEEYEVRYAVEGRGPLIIGSALGVLGTAFSWWFLRATPYWQFELWPLLFGPVLGVLVQRARRRRNQTRAQLNRIVALERAATLRDTRERGAAGFREGSVIAGRYRLGVKLGAGASGTIWEAQRLSDGATVAIKLLRAAVAHDTVAADRLRREAQALGLAWHPNVVEVYDDGVLPDGTSYLVMERLSGETLATRLRRRGTLPIEEVVTIAVQVCDALEAVHAAGIIHRDLKPSNIFLSIDRPVSEHDPARNSLTQLPTHERAKLLDFGVARVEWAETRLTNMEGPLGTPGYMSPEQEQGHEVDGRADIYALGGVIYECLCGRPPPVTSSGGWPSPDSGSALDSGVMLSAAQLPEAWRDVIEKAMAYRARDRFEDVRTFKQVLLVLGGVAPRESIST
ncbi:MAG: serine/threonine-protein kinase [Polyangiaceae bacterium]|nr:serine/threonine-protein kinase [Polyangiaceae bacterium]